MTSTPRPNEDRSAQIRSTLYNTVAQEGAAPRKRRPLLYVSLATAAALVLGGGGAILATSLHQAPAPIAVGPTSSPEPGNDPVTGADPDQPTSTPTEPGSINGVGTPSAIPVEPKSDLEQAYDSCASYVEKNGIGTLSPFSPKIPQGATSTGSFNITPGLTTPDGGQFYFVCVLPGYPTDLAVSDQSGPVGGS